MTHDNYIYANHADDNQGNVGEMLGNAGMQFLSSIASAKKDGQELPGIFDKIGDILIKGESKAIEIAKNEAAKKANDKLGWIIAGILILIILFLIFKLK